MPALRRWLARVAGDMVAAPNWAAWMFIWLGFVIGAFSCFAIQLIYQA